MIPHYSLISLLGGTPLQSPLFLLGRAHCPRSANYTMSILTPWENISLLCRNPITAWHIFKTWAVEARANRSEKAVVQLSNLRSLSWRFIWESVRKANRNTQHVDVGINSNSHHNMLITALTLQGTVLLSALQMREDSAHHRSCPNYVNIHMDMHICCNNFQLSRHS